MSNSIIVEGNVALTLSNLEAYLGQMELSAACPDEGNKGLQIMSIHAIETVKWLRSAAVSDTLNK